MSVRKTAKPSHRAKSAPSPRLQANSLLWLATIGVLVIVVIIVVNAVVNSTNTANIPAPAVSGAPRISVEQDVLDYGKVRYGTPVTSVFRVRNTGDQPLQILNNPKVQVIEGCCPPPVSISAMTINPGEEATVTLRFSMSEGMGGPHRFHIDLQTNDPAAPFKLLVVLSDWVA